MAAQVAEPSWHEGNLAMHRLMHAPTYPNPTSLSLTHSAAYYMRESPVQAVGALDAQRRPWTTILTGEKGFSTPVAFQKEGQGRTSGIVVQCMVDADLDPVIETINANLARRENTTVSGLGIDLMKRDRVKWAGHVMGADFDKEPAVAEHHANVAQMQAVIEIESSLTNCPKYLNKIPLQVAVPKPALHSLSTVEKPQPLSKEAIALIAAAPMCFLTSSHEGKTLSTNHRGGSPGFLRLVEPEQLSADARASLPIQTQNPILVLPEYSGNRLYQSLGNLYATPFVGIAIPDFHTGDIFYATANTRILIGSDSARFMPRTNLSIAMELVEWRLVQHGLGLKFTGDWEKDIDWSPYNPPIRYLATETLGASTMLADSAAGGIGTATLVDKMELSPNVARFTFEVAPKRGSDISLWRAGQYVVLDFNSELNQGYSHSNDADPSSLNDDLIRTFTVSSVPNLSSFQITIRNVGRCTEFLFRANIRARIEIGIVSFGGDFVVQPADEGAREEQAAPAGTVGFVAGGMGITPLLAQMPTLRRSGRNVRVWWAVRAADMGFVSKVMDLWRHEDTRDTSALDTGMDAATKGEMDARLFVSGLEHASAEIRQIASELKGRGVQVYSQRVRQEDLSGPHVHDLGTVYLCAGKAMTQSVDAWLGQAGKKVITESFNF